MSKLTDVDLINELSEDTETPLVIPSLENHDFGSDENFDTSMIQDVEIESEEPRPAEKEAEPMSQDKKQRMALRFVKVWDFLQKSIMKWGYKRSILKEDDVQKVKDFREKHSNTLTDRQIQDRMTNDSELSSIISRMDRFLKATETLALTADEKEELAEPMMELIEKYAYMRLSPEGSFALTAFFIMLPRLEPIFPNIADLVGNE